MPILRLLQPQIRNFWQKAFGKKLPYNAFVEVNNLLVRSRILDVRLDQVLDMVEKYGVLWRRRFLAEKKQIYRDWLKSSLIEKRFDQIEIQKLRKLKDLLLLNDYEVGEIHQALSQQYFHEVIEAAMEDERLPKDQRHFLRDLERHLRLSIRYRQVLEEINFKALMEDLLAEVRPPQEPLSKEESRMMVSIENVLWFCRRNDLPPRDGLKELQAAWLFINGFWPSLPVDTPLRPGEFCVYFTNAALVPMSETARYLIRKPNLMRRVDLGYDWPRVQEDGPMAVTEPPDAQHGRLYVTNRGFIFSYAGHRTRYSFSHMANCAVRQEGLYILHGKKPAVLFRFRNQNRLLAVAICRLIADYFNLDRISSRVKASELNCYRPG